MSSIYRKGRDGYYYYQSYELNSKTGKKDKRIFHSLGTKDTEEAKIKQAELDYKYENKKQKNVAISRLLKSYIKEFTIIFVTVLITLFFSGYFEKKENGEIIQSDDFYKNKFSVTSDFKVKPDIDKLDSLGNDIKEMDTVNFSEDNLNLRNAEFEDIVKIPKFEIRRLESLSGAFSQCKIFVTTKSNLEKSQLLVVCEKIVKQYSKYSNILICIYSDSEIGNELAMGINTQIISENHKNAWLAMYSFNPVEGAYFDNNPASYLGDF